MRDFFIRSFEKLVSLIVILLCAGVLIASIIAMTSGEENGFLLGAAILIGGGFYVILLGGLMFLGLGIYDNTKRTADAVERMAKAAVKPDRVYPTITV